MVNRSISDDLKTVALRLKAHNFSVDLILDVVGFSLRTYQRVVARHNEIGTVSKAPAIGRGRPRTVDASDVDYIKALVKQMPYLYLDEICEKLLTERYLNISLSTLQRTFTREHFTRKRLQKIATERSPFKRSDYIRRISQYPAKMLVFIDETAKDERTYFRSYGRSLRGIRPIAKAPFVRGKRYTLLPAMDITGIIAQEVREGSFTKVTFLRFLDRSVVSQMA